MQRDIYDVWFTAGRASAQGYGLGATYSIPFMNITPDTGQEGFIQMFAAATNVTTIVYQVAHTSTLVENLTLETSPRSQSRKEMWLWLVKNMTDWRLEVDLKKL